MRNTVAKKLRKDAGKQTSDSNRIYYEQLKSEHKSRNNPQEPKIKRSRRSLRRTSLRTRIEWPTNSTVYTGITPKRHRDKLRRKLKA